ALFNWLYARHTGGKMLLRIEDTDRERSTDAAIAAILDGLAWLGLDWDGEPIYQLARAERHRAVAEDLVRAGKAYYAYDTAEELNDARAKARAAGGFARYDGKWRNRDAAEAPAGIAPVVRVKAPLEGETVIEDGVQGRVAFPNKDLDDFIILRSDGTPTYMLAVVVDDHDMGVTQIIRGDDHLTNGARQKILYEAAGWDVPAMAHIPLIHGPDGAKLSKRHGALGVDAYRAMGYLPEAMRNYLVRLGWSHGDAEIMSGEEMIAWFDIPGINKAAARFDFQKLESINAHYLRQMPDDALFATLLDSLPLLPEGEAFAASLDATRRAQLRAALPLLKDRAKTLRDLIDGASFITATRPLAIDEAGAALLAKDGARAALAALVPVLEAEPDWSTAALEAAVKAHATAAGVKLGAIAQPLRAALTGRAASPGIFDVLAILGRDESLARIRDQAGGPA
ncbi:MAG: glutamate--tRNA ligase, partial [Rhizobiales bacterium]|nr:glutamate--tRNA ligase [Hyphomicrobiales bacterium]